MMLRASIDHQGQKVDLGALTGEVESVGLPGGEALIAFADAVVAAESGAIAVARDRVRAELGDAATVDAAGVIANFQRMVRIADGTGIPLDPPMQMMTEGIRQELGINDFASASNTQPLGTGGRLVARLLGPLASPLFRNLRHLLTRLR